MKFSSDTKVMAAQAPVRICDIPVLPETEADKGGGVTEWQVLPGCRVYAMDPATGEHRWYGVTVLSLHRDCELFDVKLGKRYSSVETVTEDHSLITYNPEKGLIEPSRPSESIGRLVPAVVGIPDQTDPLGFWDVDGTFYGEARSASIPLERPFGRVVGSVVGDGWVSTTDQLNLATNFTEVSDEVQASLDKAGVPQNSPAAFTNYETESLGSDMPVGRRRMNIHTPGWFNKALAVVIGRGSGNKTLPWFSLQAGRDHLLGVMEGLLSTDGAISITTKKSGKVSGTVGYDTVSTYLRDGVIYLCQRLGIRTSVTPYRGKHSTMDCYRISMSTVDVKRLWGAGDLELFNTEKADRLAYLVQNVDENSPVADACDRIPYPVFAHESILNIRRESEFMPAVAVSDAKRKGHMSREKALKLVAELRKLSDVPEALQLWMALAEDTTVTWKTVEAVTPAGRQDCWDITVPGPYTFVTGAGIVVQDTQSLVVPVSADAVQEARDKMMPEKNLISEGTGRPQFVPFQETLEALYIASRAPKKRRKVQVYKTDKEAREAWKQGLIDVDDPVHILED